MRRNLAYIALMLCICMLPSAGMLLFGPTVETRENRTLAKWPGLTDESGRRLNVRLLSEAGEWVTDHFALKNEMVTANAAVRADVFHVSASDKVILGREGWLYYASSLDDYRGANLMSRRALFNLAHTMGMTARLLEKKGISFLFAAAPNKNTIYPDFMPYYDRAVVSDRRNLDALGRLLAEEEVPFADLKTLLQEQAADMEEGQYLYHKRDSHWTSLGAAMAMDAMLTKLGKIHAGLDAMPWHTEKDFEGDLDRMLFPLAVTPDEEVYFDRAEAFAYVTDTESTFDPWIRTINPSREGSLMMYRDSFGNAMVPLFAQEYENAYFSRGEPSNMTNLADLGIDTVIILRAERFLPEMAGVPPLIEAEPVLPDRPVIEAQGADAADASSLLLSVRQDSGLYRLTGALPQDVLEDDAGIYIQVNGEICYEAFPCCIETYEGISDTGFAINLSPLRLIPGVDRIGILVETGEGLLRIYEGKVYLH